MSNNTNCLKAVEMISSAYKKRMAEYDAALSIVRREVPVLSELEARLAKNGAKAALAALSGDTNSLKALQSESLELLAQKEEIVKSAGIIKPEPCCSICGDTGYKDAAYCSCVKALAKELTIKSLSQNMPIENCRFDTFDLKYYPDKPNSDGVVPRKVMTTILKTAKEYCIGFGKNSKSLLFMGGVGLGKTHISLSIVAEIIEKGFNVVYGTAQNIFSGVEKEHFSYSGETPYLDSLLSSDLLVIDDLGTEFGTTFTQSAFYNIVNTRILSGLPTIINTNLSFKELEERYTPRITSRFIGSYEMITFFGNDIRLKKMLDKK